MTGHQVMIINYMTFDLVSLKIRYEPMQKLTNSLQHIYIKYMHFKRINSGGCDFFSVQESNIFNRNIYSALGGS
jgi:hypothetical protein